MEKVSFNYIKTIIPKEVSGFFGNIRVQQGR